MGTAQIAGVEHTRAEFSHGSSVGASRDSLHGRRHGSRASAVVAALTEGGTYEDPTTGGPLTGDALAATIDGVYRAFPELQAHITPSNMDGVTEFGISLRVETGRDTIPGAFTVTWIEVDPEHQMDLIDATSNIVMEQLGSDAYLGSCFATVGRRNFTFTAWTDPEAAQEALRGEAHSAAMKLAQSGGLGHTARGIISMWTPHFLNGVFHPGARSTDLSTLGGQWL